MTDQATRIRAAARALLDQPAAMFSWAPLYVPKHALHAWPAFVLGGYAPPPSRTLCGIEALRPSMCTMISTDPRCEKCRELEAEPVARVLMVLAEQLFADGEAAEREARDQDDRAQMSFGRGGKDYSRPTLLGAPDWVFARLVKFFPEDCDVGRWLAQPQPALGGRTPAVAVFCGATTWEQVCERMETANASQVST